jgi:hypothetical protein
VLEGGAGRCDMGELSPGAAGSSAPVAFPSPLRLPVFGDGAAGAAGLGLRVCPRESLKKSPSKVLFMVTLKNIEVIFSLPLCHEP